jgi:hypothetical protein
MAEAAVEQELERQLGGAGSVGDGDGEDGEQDDEEELSWD